MLLLLRRVARLATGRTRLPLSTRTVISRRPARVATERTGGALTSHGRTDVLGVGIKSNERDVATSTERAAMPIVVAIRHDTLRFLGAKDTHKPPNPAARLLNPDNPRAEGHPFASPAQGSMRDPAQASSDPSGVPTGRTIKEG